MQTHLMIDRLDMFRILVPDYTCTLVMYNIYIYILYTSMLTVQDVLKQPLRDFA